MAETIKLQVELENKINQSKQIASELKSQGGFKGNPKAEQSIALITQELESLAKISNPTLKNLSRIEVLFDQLSEILLKVAQTTKTTTEEFKRIEKELADLQGKESELKKRRSALFKEGRVNKDSGKYELYNTYQDEVVAKAGIKNAKGVDIKRSSTFLSKFDETGNPIQGAFQDPAAAKKIYDELLATQTKNADELREINEALATYKIKIEQKTQELEGQGQSENNTLPGKIISNKTQVNRLIDSEKEQIHSEEDQKKLTTSIEGTTVAIQKQTSSLGRAFKQFTIYNIAIKAVRMALNEAKQTIKELDKYLTEQAMVTGKTREQTYKLIDSYQNLALQCGATTKEIAEVATEYMKQGKTIEDSLVLTEAAVKAAKVARVSVGDSVNYLTTALNGFRLEADQAMAVSDKFAAIAAASATDYDELAIALSKVASQANLAGMSIDYTTALLTKGLETTREAPETMGTALKTIIARMRELGDYGETLDDGMDINNVESQLKYVGIALRDSNGELRSTEEVLDELGHKWDDLNKNQQAAIAKALAGTRQQSRLIAMMEDYERVTELQEISQRSAGATAAQAGVFLEGMESSLNKIQVAWEKIVMTLTDSKVIIGTLDIAGKALDKIGDSLKDTGKQVGLFTTLATIGALMLGNKLREHDIAKQENKLALERSIIEQKAAIEKRQSFIETSQAELEKNQRKEKEIAQNEIVLAQKKELGLQEEHNKAVAAEAAAEQKAAQADLIAKKHEQNAADAKIIADAENAHAVTLEMEAAEAKSTAQAAEKHQIELESLKVKLQEKALTEEGLSAQEQALLNNIDNEIALSKEKEKEARNQAKYASIQAEAARDVAKDADNEYKKRQKVAKLQRGKADAAKKELDSAKKLTKTTADNLNNAKKITTEKEKNLTDLEATHKKQLEDNASQIEAAKKLLKLDEEKLNLLYEQQGGLMGIFGLWNRLKGLMLLFKPIYAGVLFFQKLINKEKNKEYVATLRQQAAEAKGFRKKLLNAAASAAESVAANPF
jgi:TP901 family phage tail tape measure protein